MSNVQLSPAKQILKVVLEFGPLVVFFIANAYGKIFVGTASFMAATAVSLCLSWLFFKKIPTMPLFTGILVLGFGAATLYFQDSFFIKIKPTVVNLLFAAILFTGLYFRQTLLKILFDGVIELDEAGWRQLTYRWAGFFVFLALLNEIVWRNFSDDFWVNFKVFGIMPITAIFAMFQIGLMQKHQISPSHEDK